MSTGVLVLAMDVRVRGRGGGAVVFVWVGALVGTADDAVTGQKTGCPHERSTLWSLYTSRRGIHRDL